MTDGPWEVHDGSGPDYTICQRNGVHTCQPLFDRIGPDDKCADGEWICLARAAFDVMMLCKWVPKIYNDGTWGIQDRFGEWPTELLGLGEISWADPFTALVEANAWYKANVENKT